jgi:hypothetical protein
MNSAAGRFAARALNLVLPGGGLVVAGHPWLGLLTGALFVAAANVTVAAVFLFSDDFSTALRALAIGVGTGAYVGAQIRLEAALRFSAQQRTTAARDAALRAAWTALEAGDAPAALAALRPVENLAPRDLLLAYRLAQTLTLTGDVPAALAAWEHVRRLDRHNLYRDLRLRSVSELRGEDAAAG